MLLIMEGTTIAPNVADTHGPLFAALDRLAERYGAATQQADTSVDQAVDAVVASFNLLLTELSTLPDVMELSQLTAFEQKIAARRLVVAARASGASGDARTDRRRARDVLDSGSGSTRSKANDAKRAATIAANPTLGDAVADGTVTPEAIDQLNKAADSATGIVPEELIKNVSGLSADQTAQVVDRFQADRIDADEVEEKYQQQMTARSVRRYQARGLSGIAVEGPDALIDAMWEHINLGADSRYRDDGGRDTPSHEQTPLDHRRFDAAQAALLVKPGRAAGGPLWSSPLTVIGFSIHRTNPLWPPSLEAVRYRTSYCTSI